MTCRLQYRQTVNIPLDRAWAFFSQAGNLGKLTPPEMNLRMTTDDVPEIFAGQLISYSLTPVFNFQMKWPTEIKYVNRPFGFVDEQRLGPYRFWFHRHTFRPVERGTEIVDEITYALPGGWLGSRFLGPYVRKQLDKVFAYRYAQMQSLPEEALT